jgi:NAD-dependent deacetylase
MPEKEMKRAQQEAESADLLIVAGSSLSVFPAAKIPLYAKEKGALLVILNNEKTNFDEIADLVINESISDTLKRAI